MANTNKTTVQLTQEDLTRMILEAEARGAQRAAAAAPAAVPAAEDSDDECGFNDTDVFDRFGGHVAGRIEQTRAILHGHPFVGGAIYNRAHKAVKTTGYKSARRPFASATCEAFFDGDADAMYRFFHPFRTAASEIID